MDTSKIAVVIYDNVDLDIRQNLIDITIFKILSGPDKFDITIASSITKTLKQLIKQEYKWAVVVAAGTFMSQQHIIIDTIEHAQKYQSPLSCHLIDRGGYFHLHPQWFALDLEVYDRIGTPWLEYVPAASTFTTNQTRRSKENIHDDYTPLWVDAKNNTPQTYTSDQQYFGLRLITQLVANNFTIVNVPEHVRKYKIYSYPESFSDELTRMINQHEYVTPGTPDPKTNIIHEFGAWIKFNVDIDKTYFVSNTEPLLPMPTQPFDCFVGVASGLKFLSILSNNNFAPDTQVTLIDISPAALAWQQHLLRYWNGDIDQYSKIVKLFQLKNPSYKFGTYFTNIDNLSDAVLLLGDFNADSLKIAWQRYCQMSHQFVLLDLATDAAVDTLAQIINKSGVGCYVWTSNAFHMDHQVFANTLRSCSKLEQDFVDQLQQKISIPMFADNFKEMSAVLSRY